MQKLIYESSLSFQELLLRNNNEKNIIKDSATLSFNEVFSNAINLAKSIYAIKGKGNRLLVPAFHNIRFVQTLLAIIFSGNIAVPVNPNLPAEQLKKITDKFKIENIPDFVKQGDFLPEIKPDDPALVILTSGSTGEPKAVSLTHHGILANALSVIKSMGLEKPGKIAIMLPLYHSFALVTQLITTLISGGQIYLVPEFKFPGELIQFINDNKIETLAGVPTNFKMILMGNELVFSLVKHITVAGAALEPVFAQRIKKAFPNASLWVGYGLTEAGPRVTAINDSEPAFKLGSVGKPIEDVEIKIKNHQVLVKSPSVMAGYLDDQKTTSEKIIAHWLYTGDLGQIDKNGYLFISGRKDDIFISGGEKISPLSIEKIINKYPGVNTSAVYGEPDSILGNKIIALIQTKENVIMKPKDLLLHCRKFLENFLVPHKFMKVTSLPLTANGKLQRKELSQCQKEKL
jgi:long-chain acyl-CoA synthetase